MKHLMLSAAAIVVAFGLGACERETRTVEKGGTTVVQPTTKEKETVVLPAPGKETVKEKETVVTTPGPAGPAGAAGTPGSDTGSASSETNKETTTETSKETKKE